jgi:predicted metal-dependent enzyme (double-stranded beta helix superfamily)
MTEELAPPIRELFDLVDESTRGASPDLAAIGAALSSLAAHPKTLEAWITRLGDRSGATPIHAPTRGPRLVLVHRLEGQMSAVHDHGTWVAISPIRGIETHRQWRVRREGDEAPRVELADDRALADAQVATLLPPDDVHDHGHLVGRGDPAYVLILLGDDQTHFTRNEWDVASGRHRVLRPGDGGRWVSTEPFPD